MSFIFLDESGDLGFDFSSRKETNKFLNQNFKNYLHSQIAKNHNLKVTVSIKTPAEQKALQAVDFISWAIFRKYEYQR